MSTTSAPEPAVPDSLIRNVSMLCLDAGNTVIYLDHARLVALSGQFGFATDVAALIDGEGGAKRALEDGDLVDPDWAQRHLPGARGWGRYLATLMVRAGLSPSRAAAFLEWIWPEHVRWNLFSKVPDGLADALRALRERGVRVAIVSNSEGILEGLFRSLGVRDCFDAVVDSGLVGVEKPDPRIFDIALREFSVTPDRAVMLGDLYATDIVGAREAGLRAALIDPHGHLAGRHADVPRVRGALDVAEALARQAR